MFRVVFASKSAALAPRRVWTAVLLAALLFPLIPSPFAHAKRPGSTYCFVGKCHRVKTLSETRSLVGKDLDLVASHYDACHKDRYNPCGLTSSGEPFFPHRPDNAASPILPDGTRVLVWNPATKAAALLRINNAGPYWGNRKLDVSRATAERLGFEKRGVAKLKTRIISAPSRSASRYKRNRRYEHVAGYLGKFDSIDEAEKGLAAVIAVRAMATSAIAPVVGGVIAASHAEPVRAERKRRKIARKAAPFVARIASKIALDDENASQGRAASTPLVRIAGMDIEALDKVRQRIARGARLARLHRAAPVTTGLVASRTPPARMRPAPVTRPGAIPVSRSALASTATSPARNPRRVIALPARHPLTAETRLAIAAGQDPNRGGITVAAASSLRSDTPPLPTRMGEAPRGAAAMLAALPPATPVGNPARLEDQRLRRVAEHQRKREEAIAELERTLLRRHFRNIRSSQLQPELTDSYQPLPSRAPVWSREPALRPARGGIMG